MLAFPPSSRTPKISSWRIRTAGFAIEPHRVITETISGYAAIAKRPGFARLLDKMESGDVLIVTKMDRLDRDAIDVTTAVARLQNLGIRVHCLALGDTDLTSSAGKLTIGGLLGLSMPSQFERDLLVERTQAGLERAKAQGKRLGRPPALADEEKCDVMERLGKGESVAAVARGYKVSRQSIMRIRNAL